MQQPDEIVAIGGLEVSRIQFLGQSEEWLGFAGEVVQFENGRRVGKFVFAQIVVESSIG